MRLVVLLIGLLVLSLGFASLFSVGLSGPETIEEIERSFRLAPGKALYVQGENGEITYENWDGDEVVVRATKVHAAVWGGFADRYARRIEVEISEDASGVRAVQKGRFGFFFGNMKVRYHLLVPRNWSGQVTLRTSNGSIRAEGLRGEAELRTSNGRITVEGQSGSLKAHTSNGRIELSNIDGTVEAHTSNGQIRIDGGRLEGAGRLRTSNGDVRLFAQLEKDAAYTVRTSNGSVILVLAEPDVTVDLATTNGGIDLHTEVSTTRLGRNELVGRIGDGSARLEVRTSNGTISLSHAGSAAP